MLYQTCTENMSIKFSSYNVLAALSLQNTRCENEHHLKYVKVNNFSTALNMEFIVY